MTVLMDSSVLIPIAVDDHEHHDAAATWFSSLDDGFATCPITEGALVRYLVRNGWGMRSAKTFLTAMAELERHEFWPDSLCYADVPGDGVRGHRQVTDAYLAQLARSRGSRLATFDQGFAASHSDVADLVPTEEKS